jgi:hypothetical protein
MTQMLIAPMEIMGYPSALTAARRANAGKRMGSIFVAPEPDCGAERR